MFSHSLEVIVITSACTLFIFCSIFSILSHIIAAEVVPAINDNNNHDATIVCFFINKINYKLNIPFKG
jgi:hypothetical protein